MDIIITGAGKGIGYELAKIFAFDTNNKLFLISRSAERLSQLKKECLEINKDIFVDAIPFDLELMIKENKYPLIMSNHIDILINNAGLLINKNFIDQEPDDIHKIINVNFLAPAFLIRKYLQNMGGSRVTHIVNIGSMGGFQGSSKFPGLSIYSASKAALASFTECLAVEFEEMNIRCNCLALGSVQTEMLKIAFPGFKAPVRAEVMAQFIADFAMKGHKIFNGKVLPVALSST